MDTAQTIPEFSRSIPFPPAIARWSGVVTDYPRNKTIADLFEETALRYAQETALTFGDKNVTYGELNLQADRLAQRLRSLGVQPESLVACLMDRSVEYIVSILGILKAGGAYVPIDPSLPASRVALILQDTKTKLVLTNRDRPGLPPTDAQIFSVADDSWAANSGSENKDLHGPAARATSLAYVMYTSGTTGRPKGVMVENRGIVRLVRNTNYCRFGPDQAFLQLAPLSFDASTFEIWGALLNGSRLVIMPPGVFAVDDVADAIERHGITTMWLTAPLFHLMVEQKVDAIGRLAQLLAGGDVLSPRHVRAFLQTAPNTLLINGYGPTENTTFTCCHAMRHGDSIPDSVPIGKPVSNTRVYIVDDQFVPVDVGEAGELCCGGDGVARGYLNQPDATAAQFVPDPFAAEPGKRIYRTGDRARWNADGSIEFLGRMDAQVKVLGHRIEPLEIESVILKSKDIKDVCVVANTDSSGHKRLVAYFVPNGTAASADKIREALLAELPQYMMPAIFVSLDSLPLSENGKVDRGSLSARTPGQETSEEAIEGSKLEGQIAALWREVLSGQEIGIDQNFFDLGGDSLLLVSVHSRLQKLLNREIPVTDLFAWPTVRGLARHLADGNRQPTVIPGAQTRSVQQRESFDRWRHRHSAADRE